MFLILFYIKLLYLKLSPSVCKLRVLTRMKNDIKSVYIKSVSSSVVHHMFTL